jgi:hypothetical protein
MPGRKIAIRPSAAPASPFAIDLKLTVFVPPLWEEGILGDFQEFKKSRLLHSQIAEIEAIFSRK